MGAGKPLRGLVGQGMGGPKPGQTFDILGILDVTSGSSSVTATRSCWAMIYAFGPGGSGSNGTQGGGGGGGAALFKRVRLGPQQSIAVSIGAPGAAGLDGGDTTVTLPAIAPLFAGGGKAGVQGVGAPGGVGGVAIGGDINRNGAAGGANASAGVAAGTGGGLGGAAGAPQGCGGGGGGAGFSDIGASLGGGNGGAGGVFGGNGGNYGGGAGAGNGGAAGTGGLGRVLILLVRQR